MPSADVASARARGKSRVRASRMRASARREIEAHCTPGCRGRRAARAGDGAALAVGACLSPDPEGGAHDCRSGRRATESAQRTSPRRSATGASTGCEAASKRRSPPARYDAVRPPRTAAAPETPMNGSLRFTHLREVRSTPSAPTASTRRSASSASPQRPRSSSPSGARVLNFCANNYLGLANDPRLVAAARDGLARYGFGLASVRFICGTQSVHTELEAALAAFLGHRRRHPLLELLRRERRPVRDAARRGGRRHQRRAQPREHRRRHPPLQGEALPLPQQRHGGPRGEARAKPRPRAPASS